VLLKLKKTHKSLNSGDVFLVDLGKDLIQWNGSKAGILEKAKAAEIVQALEGERNGHAKGRVVDEGTEEADFWVAIGGKGPIASAEAGGSDLEVEKVGDFLLFRLSDASGKFEFTEVAKAPKLNKAQLDTNDVFIVDGGSEVIAWVGHKASGGEKKKALQFAQEYVVKHNKHPATSVWRVLEGAENHIFDTYFH